MLRAVSLIALAGTFAACPFLTAETDHSLTAIENRLTSLYQEHKDAVVKVKVATKTVDENGNEKIALTVLSGFFIDEQGTVLTNAVPTHDGPRLRVEKNGAQLLAVAIGSDPISNIALLRLAKPPKNIQYVDLEDASSKIETGAIAYAITSPLDFSATPKLGLIGGHESSFGDIDFPFTHTRIGIASGPAEGGSPVFNSKGQLIGISVATLPEIASSYIVPTLPLQEIITQLRQKRSVSHPEIKARFEEKGSPIDMSRRVVVSDITKSSNAEKGGLQVGDHILRFQGNEISNVNQLRDAIFFSAPGTFVTFTVERNDEQKEIPVLLESK